MPVITLLPLCKMINNVISNSKYLFIMRFVDCVFCVSVSRIVSVYSLLFSDYRISIRSAGILKNEV